MLNPSVAELELRTHKGQTISGLSEMQPRLVLVPGVLKFHLGGISSETLYQLDKLVHVSEAYLWKCGAPNDKRT